MPCGRLRNIGARLYNLLSVSPAQMEPTMPGTTNVMRSLELRGSPHSRLACQSKGSNSADWNLDAEYPLDIFPACRRCLGNKLRKPAIGQDGDHLCLDFSDGQTAEFLVRSRSRRCIADTKSREVVPVDTDAGSRGLRHHFFGIISSASFLWHHFFGIISLAFSKELASGQPLSRGVCAFISIFWGIRLLIPCFVFDAKPYLRTLFLKVGYHALTVVFAWHTLVYAFAALS